ncbi:FapA family protein [Thermaerobacter subterraneus]|uniref:Polymerase with PALM domain, HD hydrolase domain and Zn ribbon n=1 Tax=Thermaerobacter subterraneus DSM 13965 TaxID=867903 RepID=K6QCB1_9FIRM|nr:FapA family protein [Thermaerobacter subterraneus]EKP94121.1 putative polymerase with PALM domain, HD hydrolase domain and Zn ribbon [Thermaerobacter subterraneus DSM 13965]
MPGTTSGSSRIMEELAFAVPARNAVEAFARAIERSGYPPERLVPRRAEVVRPGRRLAWWWIRPPLMRVILAVRPVPPAEGAQPEQDPPAPGTPGPVQTPTMARVRHGRLEILPGSPDEPAILVPGPGVRLNVNGTDVDEAVAVTAADRVEAQVASGAGWAAGSATDSITHPHADSVTETVTGAGSNASVGAGAGAGAGSAAAPIEVRLAPDGLQASVRVPLVRLRVLKEAGPTRVLHLETATLQRPPAGLTVEAIMDALAEAGVTEGIDSEAVVQVATEGAPLPVTVARGRPPRDGRDGKLVAVVGAWGSASRKTAAEAGPWPATGVAGTEEDGAAGGMHEDGASAGAADPLAIAVPKADSVEPGGPTHPDPFGLSGPAGRAGQTEPSPRPVRDGRARSSGRAVLSIPEGSLVGYIVPPEPGQPGRGVDGRVLPARDGRPAQVRCGQGVVVVKGPGGRQELRALRQGRPVVQRVGRLAWYVDVVPLLVHDGDLTAATGSVRFDGDVIVTGSVSEGAAVVAGGRIQVFGGVDHGLLEAAGDVTVEGAVIQARVVAGARARFYGRLRGRLEPLQEVCRRVQAAMRLVEGAASFQNRDIARFGPGRLVRLLVEMKFRDVQEQARSVHRLLAAHRGPLDPPVEALRQPLAELAGTVGDGFDLPGLIAALGEAAAFLQWFETPAPATATVGYVHNGVVEATGAIRVGPAGTYHARLWAGERVSVQGPVVGGTVEAGRAVHVLEAGSTALPATVLAVGEGGIIRAGFAHENVWLRVGERQRRLAEPRADLRVGSGTNRSPNPVQGRAAKAYPDSPMANPVSGHGAAG